MTPQDLKAWRDAMGFTSQRMAAEALGVNVATIENMERGVRRDGKPSPIDLRTALACAALFHRLNPWGAG